MLGTSMVWLIVGLLCKREQRSPWRQALQNTRTRSKMVSQHNGGSPANSQPRKAYPILK